MVGRVWGLGFETLGGRYCKGPHFCLMNRVNRVPIPKIRDSIDYFLNAT